MKPSGWYQLRKAAGVCCGSWTCKHPREAKSAFCEMHLRNRHKAQRTWATRQYMAHKLAGICVGHGIRCTNPAPEDRLRCDACADMGRVAAAKYGRTTRGKAKRRAALKRWRKDRIEKGLCIRCDNEIVTETLCEDHRQDMRRKLCASQGKKWTPKVAKRARAPMLPVEHYASARMAVDL